MPERPLLNRRLLIVEDEYLLADELQAELEDAGAIVLGPAATVADAIALIEAELQIDGALLDANLGGEIVFPVADLLVGRDIPFIFATGYDGSASPARFAGVPRCEKPVTMTMLTRAVAQVMRPVQHPQLRQR